MLPTASWPPLLLPRTNPRNVRPAGTLQIALKHLALEPPSGQNMPLVASCMCASIALDLNCFVVSSSQTSSGRINLDWPPSNFRLAGRHSCNNEFWIYQKLMMNFEIQNFSQISTISDPKSNDCLGPIGLTKMFREKWVNGNVNVNVNANSMCVQNSAHARTKR